MAARRKFERWGLGMLRALIFAVSLPLASSGALPVWARLVGVEGPHVCHCSIDKHDCVCAKCNPELEEELLLTSESLLGRCGDDEHAFGSKAICAVVPPSSVIAPVAERVSLPPATILLVSDLARPPPTPPPRLSSSAV
ncbi:MAG: hypothetical protein J0I07_14155 [Myxococcales bacterium]|nr:hypothetical protein [Myxococcales bacterium]